MHSGSKMVNCMWKEEAYILFGQVKREIIMLVWVEESLYSNIPHSSRNLPKHSSQKRESNAGIPTSKWPEKEAHPSSPVPEICKDEFVFDVSMDEVGERCLGHVFKAPLHGTTVAHKECKLPKRVAASIKKILESKIQIHASLMHPILVQMLGIMHTITWANAATQFDHQ